MEITQELILENSVVSLANIFLGHCCFLGETVLAELFCLGGGEEGVLPLLPAKCEHLFPLAPAETHWGQKIVFCNAIAVRGPW